jgi:hypothetical protein
MDVAASAVTASPNNAMPISADLRRLASQVRMKPVVELKTLTSKAQ